MGNTGWMPSICGERHKANYVGMYKTKTATCSPTNAQQEFCGTVEGDIESVCVCVLDGLLHTLHAATH